jgi:hypothetical protein
MFPRPGDDSAWRSCRYCSNDSNAGEDGSQQPLSLDGPDAEVPVEDGVVLADLVGGALVDDVALLQDVGVLGDGQRDGDVLFDQEDGDAAVVEVPDDVLDVADDVGSQSLGGIQWRVWSGEMTNVSGLTASRPPARPAMAPLMTNARRLYRVTS